MQVRVRFDVKEALEELTRLKLIESVGSEGENGIEGPLYSCVKPQEATKQLQHTWESILEGRLQSVQAPSSP